MKSLAQRWAPTAILVSGASLMLGVQQQHVVDLRGPLDSALPYQVGGLTGQNVIVTEAEAAVAGFTDYVLRVYSHPAHLPPDRGDPTWASVYLGFYNQQTRGRTIHSPKNCLPGAGWEALSSKSETITVGSDRFTVNRYLLQNGDERALVLYWYQGRGRVAHNEYLVKWDLFRDAALKRRTDEALVRIVVPIQESEAVSFEFARLIAMSLHPALHRVLPS